MRIGIATIRLWRNFCAVIAGYWAGLAMLAGVHGLMVEFDLAALTAGLYVFSCCKSHSAVTRLRRGRSGR